MKQFFILISILFLLFGCIVSTNTPQDINKINQSDYSKESTETITCIFTNASNDLNNSEFSCEYYFMGPDPSLSPQKGCNLVITKDLNEKDCTFQITQPKGTTIIIRSSKCNEKFSYNVGDSNIWNYQTNLSEYNPQKEFTFSC